MKSHHVSPKMADICLRISYSTVQYRTVQYRPEHVVEAAAEPGRVAVNEQHDCVGEAELRVQDLHHLRYQLVVTAGGVSEAGSVHHLGEEQL